MGVLPGFVVPLFVSTAPDNRLYTQVISSDDHIRSFEVVDIGDVAITRHSQNAVRTPGEPALWAFQFQDGTCSIESRSSLRSTIIEQEHYFAPLLRVQVAAFFETDDLAARLGDAHAYLTQTAPRSAGLWRDLVILLPRIRRAVTAAANRPTAQIYSSIGTVDIISHGETLTIAVPASLIETMGGELAFSKVLSPLEPVFNALGIRRLDIQQRAIAVPVQPQVAALPPSGLTLVHCLRDVQHAPARKLREVRHLNPTDLVDDNGTLDRAKLPAGRDLVLLLVEDHEEQVRAATVIAQAMTGRSEMTAALIIPRSEELDGQRLYRPIRQTDAMSALASHCRWVAYASDVIDYDDDLSEPLASNPHYDRQIDDVARWTPHALRACVNADVYGNAALRALGSATARFGSCSVSSASSRGKDAADAAATAALTASRRTRHPAVSAQLIVLVVFHHGTLDGNRRDEVERAAFACNPEAKIMVVEEYREIMFKRVRVVAITTGHHRPTGPAYTPPARLMPLVRAGWRIEPTPYLAHWQFNTVAHNGFSYVLRFEPDLTVSADNIDEIIATTSMHHGEVALLVKAIAEESLVKRLLSAGIFCGVIRQRHTFERFGPAPGVAIRAALAGMSRSEIASRLHHFAGDYVVAGLWRLIPHWQRHGQSLYSQWMEGDYGKKPILDQFELYRVTQDENWFFRGVVKLTPKKPNVPPLSYAFGFALEDKGLRLTRLKPLAGESDIRADALRRFEERYYKQNRRHFGKSASTRVNPPEQTSIQWTFPGLPDLTDD